jgi:hypothetical protein
MKSQLNEKSKSATTSHGASQTTIQRKEAYHQPLLIKHERLVDITGAHSMAI